MSYLSRRFDTNDFQPLEFVVDFLVTKIRDSSVYGFQFWIVETTKLSKGVNCAWPLEKRDIPQAVLTDYKFQEFYGQLQNSAIMKSDIETFTLREIIDKFFLADRFFMTRFDSWMSQMVAGIPLTNFFGKTSFRVKKVFVGDKKFQHFIAIYN